MELLNKIVALANTVDARGQYAVADDLDIVARDVLKIAQYVGVQGYWVRNERCWSNCYRQKRAAKPSLSAQEVWWECQEEFEKSINNDGSKWDKYADAAGVIRTAEYQQDQTAFADFMAKAQVTADAVIGSVIGGEIETLKVAAAAKMEWIAEQLASHDAELSRQASDLSEGILKEAGPWNVFKGVGQSLFRGGVPGGIAGVGATVRLKNSVTTMETAWKKLQAGIQVYNNAIAQVTKDINALTTSKSGKVREFGKAALPVVQQLKNIEPKPALLNQTNQLIARLKNLAQGIPADATGPAGAQPPPLPQQPQATPGAAPPPLPTAAPAAPAAQAPAAPVAGAPGAAKKSVPGDPDSIQARLSAFPQADQASLLQKLQQLVQRERNYVKDFIPHGLSYGTNEANTRTLFSLLKTAGKRPRPQPPGDIAPPAAAGALQKPDSIADEDWARMDDETKQLAVEQFKEQRDERLGKPVKTPKGTAKPRKRRSTQTPPAAEVAPDAAAPAATVEPPLSETPPAEPPAPAEPAPETPSEKPAPTYTGETPPTPPASEPAAPEETSDPAAAPEAGSPSPGTIDFPDEPGAAETTESPSDVAPAAPEPSAPDETPEEPVAETGTPQGGTEAPAYTGETPPLDTADPAQQDDTEPHAQGPGGEPTAASDPAAEHHTSEPESGDLDVVEDAQPASNEPQPEELDVVEDAPQAQPPPLRRLPLRRLPLPPANQRNRHRDPLPPPPVPANQINTNQPPLPPPPIPANQRNTNQPPLPVPPLAPGRSQAPAKPPQAPKPAAPRPAVPPAAAQPPGAPAGKTVRDILSDLPASSQREVLRMFESILKGYEDSHATSQPLYAKKLKSLFAISNLSQGAK